MYKCIYIINFMDIFGLKYFFFFFEWSLLFKKFNGQHC